MANRRFTQFYNTLHNRPAQIDCKFTVASTDSGGLGITGLKGPGISNVFMHTSSTPAGGNPNPATGIILVELEDNYNQYYFGGAQMRSPQSGSNISISTGSSLTAHAPYVITALGNTTTAQWNTVGVPVGTAPAVGISFLAAATSGSGTGVVQAPKATGSGTLAVEIIGSASLTCTSQAGGILGSGCGAYLMFQCLSATNSSTTTLVATNPADGTVIHMSFVFSNSFIQVQGD